MKIPGFNCLTFFVQKYDKNSIIDMSKRGQTPEGALMKVGDLVTFGKRNGVIVEDHTMMCSHAVDKPYRMGAMMVLIDNHVERLTYSNLRLVDESR